MYAKIIDGSISIAPGKLLGDGVVIYNPPAEMYLDLGWKKVRFIDPPEAPSGYYYEPGWEETADAILQTWTLTPLPNDIDDAEALAIILGGAT